LICLFIVTVPPPGTCNLDGSILFFFEFISHILIVKNVLSYKNYS
jgi:hypothetical protein